MFIQLQYKVQQVNVTNVPVKAAGVERFLASQQWPRRIQNVYQLKTTSMAGGRN